MSEFSYSARSDRNGSRAAHTLANYRRPANWKPAYPTDTSTPICNFHTRSYVTLRGDYLDRTPRWLAGALERATRKWLRERGLRFTVDAFHLTMDGEILVHVHAYGRGKQRRVEAVAANLAKRLRKTLVASDAIGSSGLYKVCVSWGYCPHVLADYDIDHHTSRERGKEWLAQQAA